MNAQFRKAFRRFRALASDCSPVESPVIFSPSYFAYKYCAYNWDQDPLLKKILRYTRYTIPYSFRSSMAGGKNRDLDLVHPAYQVQMAEFFYEYSGVIIDRCSKSSFSLRRPVKVTKLSSYLKHMNFKPVAGAPIINTPLPTFFKSERVSRLYKFHASDEYLSLERQFPFMMELDIQKCFYSIYTHTVAWAIKDKRTAKSGATKINLFENKIDKLFQRSNFNETNGIVVGPETSRVFAELILQDIDHEVESAVAQRNLLSGTAFTIRRYIDNYYVYAENEAHLLTIKNIIQEHLKKYKLYLNESKTVFHSRPFVTNESQFASELQRLLKNFFDDASTEISRDDPSSPVLLVTPARERQFTAKRFINEYRQILSRYSFEPGFQVTHVFGAMRKFLSRVLNRRLCNIGKGNEAHACARLTRDVCLIVHHLFSVSPNVSALELSIDVFLHLERISDLNKSVILDEVRAAITSMFKEAFYREGRLVRFEDYPLEFVYFLPIIRHFQLDDLVSEDDLLCVWRKACHNLAQSNALPYWELMVFLHYCGPDRFPILKKEIVEFLLDSLSDESFIKQADVSLALLDIVRCPHLTTAQRALVYRTAARSVGYSVSENTLGNALLDEDPWFIDWSQQIDLAKVMSSRRLRGPYG